MENPWLRKAPDHYPVNFVQNVSVDDRIQELSNFNAAKLRKVIAYPGTQKTVRIKAERQLKEIRAQRNH